MFKSLWDHLLTHPFPSLPPLPPLPKNSQLSCHQFEILLPNLKLELVWNHLIQISETYSYCPQLLCQREYLLDLTRLLALILLLTPNKQKFKTILSCIVVSPIASEIFIEIIQKKWIPLEWMIDGFISIMKEDLSSVPAASSTGMPSDGFKISRSPSFTTEVIAETSPSPDPDTPVTTIWDQILPLNESSLMSLRSTLATMLQLFIPQLNEVQFTLIRSKFSQNQLFPNLCLDFTRERLHDLLEYLDSLLDSTVQRLSGFSQDGGTTSTVSRLDEHWLFSQLSLEKTSELLNEIFLNFDDTLRSLDSDSPSISATLTIIIRLISTLLTSTSNIHKLPCPASFQSSSPSLSSRNWIEIRLETSLQIVQTLQIGSLSESIVSISSHLIRLVTTLVFVYIISARRHHPSNFHHLGAPAGSQTGDHFSLLAQLSQLLRSNPFSSHEKLNQNHVVYCLYLKCCLSLDRIGFLRDSCAKEIRLDRFIDFFPQNSFLYLSHVVGNFHQQQLTDTKSHSFIEKNPESLLSTVSPSLHFPSLTFFR